jgi:elongation factor P
MKASDIKKGMVVTLDGETYIVRDLHVQTPSSRSGNTLCKVVFRNVVTKQKLDKTFKADDVVQPVDFMRRSVQLLFKESNSCTFMDKETYEQYTVDSEALDAELPYLTDGLEGLSALIADDVLLGIELPGTVALEIVECAPGIKGASASARSKPATLSTGLVVQVPEYLASGELIKINTLNGEFISRA